MSPSHPSADGIRYAVREGGEGVPVLLIHGFTGSAADWAPFLPDLERLVRTVAVDLLGHGGSDAPIDPARHAIERQAADLAALLRDRCAAPAHVVGYSLGARVALRLAVDHPTAVRSLLLESPSAGLADPGARQERLAADAALAARLERDGIASFVDQWESAPVFATEHDLPPDVRAAIRTARLANDPGALAASLRGAGQGAMEPLGPALASITVPVSVIAGALDAVGRQRAVSVARVIPAARLVVVEGAGHAVHRESPARFARELAHHLVRASAFCTPARSRP